MSQVSDYTIDNSTGANVRADINAVLGAIATNNSGSSATGIQALGFFANTSDSKLQLRNAADNAFVNLRGFDGSLPLPDGSASSPSLFLDDDTNTGLFSSAADTLNFTTGGVERLELGATTIFNEDGADVDFRIEGDNQANLFFVDAGNDRIAIGHNSPVCVLDVRGTGTDFQGIRITNTQHSSGAASSAQLKLAITNSAGERSVRLQCSEMGNDSNDLAMDFYTGGSSSNNSESLAMRINNAGSVMIGTTTEGFSTADNFTIADSGDCGVTIRSGTSSQSLIAFSDATSGDAEFAGQLSYYHSTDEMVIGANTKQIVKIHDEHINVFAAEGTTRVNLGFSDTLGAELSLYDDAGSQKTRITGSTDTHHFFNNGGHVAIGHNSPAFTLDVRRNAPSGGRMMLLGSNGTHHTSAVASSSNGLIIFRARINVAANTTTDLVSGYGGSLVLITMNQSSGSDLQQTRVRTHAWSSTSSLFFNTYGVSSPTVTFSVASGVLRVNHNHDGAINFNVAGFIVSGPQSQ